MNLRRSLATAIAAATLALGFGLAAPAAHAAPPGPDVVTINPCVISPDLCPNPPGPTPPKGPGDLTIDPCTLYSEDICPSDPGDGDDTTTTTPDDDSGSSTADPATVVHATVTFTG